MGKICLGNDLGPDVCWLLAFIVSTEDAKGYRAAVSFYNDDLATRTGLSLAGMKRARDKAVEAGWLWHEQGAKGRAARYFVTIPAWADEMDDAAGDEQPGELTGGILAQGEPVSHRQAADIRTECEPPSSLSLPLSLSCPAYAEASKLEKKGIGENRGSLFDIPVTTSPGEAAPPAAKLTRKPKPTPDACPLFLRFWHAYPRKVDKSKAVKAFTNCKPNDALLETILAAVAWQSQSKKWQDHDGDFIPYPASWLNGRRWEDERPGGHKPLNGPPVIKRASSNPLLTHEVDRQKGANLG